MFLAQVTFFYYYYYYYNHYYHFYYYLSNPRRFADGTIIAFGV